MTTEIETLRGYVEAARRNHLAHIAVSLPALERTIAHLERAERMKEAADVLALEAQAAVDRDNLNAVSYLAGLNKAVRLYATALEPKS